MGELDWGWAFWAQLLTSPGGLGWGSGLLWATLATQGQEAEFQ